MEKEILCGIYKITSPSGKIYIGQSQNIYKRWRRYKNKGESQNQHKLKHSFSKYGANAHKFEIVELCSLEIIDEREIYYIALLNTHYGDRGLNLTDGGGGTRGYIPTAETRLRISIKNTGREKSKDEIDRTRISNTGQKRTNETKEILRQKKLAIRDEVSRKMIDVWANMKPEEKQRRVKKAAEKNKGKIHPLDAIAKTAQKNTGRKRTPHQIENIKNGHPRLAKPEVFNSPEEKNKRSNRAKQMWVERRERIEQERRMMIF